MSVTVLISAVSDEFRPYRDLPRADLERHNVHVKVQEDFKNLGGDTLDNGQMPGCVGTAPQVLTLEKARPLPSPACGRRWPLRSKAPRLGWNFPRTLIRHASHDTFSHEWEKGGRWRVQDSKKQGSDEGHRGWV
jgi:hypothetical protein